MQQGKGEEQDLGQDPYAVKDRPGACCRIVAHAVADAGCSRI